MPISSRIVLGIDPGIARLGYAVVKSSGQQLSLITYGVIETSKKETTGQRLHMLHQRLLEQINKYHPEIMVVEQLFFSKNVTTGIVVGEARGIALMTAAETSLETIEVSPNTVKLTITGYGRADKLQMQRMIQVLFRLQQPPQPDDAADAIALAICGTQPRLS